MMSLRLKIKTDPMPTAGRKEGSKALRPVEQRMLPPDPTDVLAFLSAPGTFGTKPARRIDTHISHVFLHGGRAFKLKRPVTTSFLDYSTPEARRRACEHEVEVNRRFSGNLYVRTRSITHGPEGFAIDGPGKPVDWLVEMVRFDTAQQFDVLAQRDRLTKELVVDLGRRIAEIHHHAPRRPDCGGASEMRSLTADTVSNLMDFADDLGGMLPLAEFSRHMRRSLAANARLLDLRRRFGRVRHCHADLHLANICLFEDRPTPFDAIEFDDAMASIDVIYDVAFTIMDLCHFELTAHANRLMNAWLEVAQDYGGGRILTLCMALRAAIRARVLLMTARLGEARQAARKTAQAQLYFRLALRLSRPVRRPLLLAIGGLSGTGKSTLARRLALDVAPAPGAVILRSDAIRKRLFGLEPEDRLPQRAYRREVGARVFRQMFKEARQALDARLPVILDATCQDPELRDSIAALAARQGVAFRGLWLDAPDTVLLPRISERRGDASDATAQVLARQRRSGTGAVGWTRIDASGPPDMVHRRARSALSESDFIFMGEIEIS